MVKLGGRPSHPLRIRSCQINNELHQVHLYTNEENINGQHAYNAVPAGQSDFQGASTAPGLGQSSYERTSGDSSLTQLRVAATNRGLAYHIWYTLHVCTIEPHLKHFTVDFPAWQKEQARRSGLVFVLPRCKHCVAKTRWADMSPIAPRPQVANVTPMRSRCWGALGIVEPLRLLLS